MEPGKKKETLFILFSLTAYHKFYSSTLFRGFVFRKSQNVQRSYIVLTTMMM